MDDWTEPGAFEVAPRVFRIPLPLPNDGLRAVNVYALLSAEGVVLIDAGWALAESRQLLADALGRLGAGLGDVRRFLVTHIHRDHYTQAVALRRDFGGVVGLGEGERASMDLIRQPGGAPFGSQLTLLRQLGAGDLADRIPARSADRSSERTDYELPDEWLIPGLLPLPESRVLEVVATPGHTAGHVVFHDNHGELLFAGDHVLPTITPSIGFEPVPSPNPLGAFLRSLAVVRARPDAALLPAHGPVAASAHARVDELVAHHGARLDQVLAAVGSGASTGVEVAGILRWTRRERTLADLDTFNTMLAVCETGAHLDLLVSQGRLSVTLEDGLRRYG
jgi:glyoxylase-like metal-dependent hydrolase (beta-lactamase superfamily II)